MNGSECLGCGTNCQTPCIQYLGIKQELKEANECHIKGRFQQFCKDHGLSVKIMRNISDGKRKDLYHNGWTVKRIL